MSDVKHAEILTPTERLRRIAEIVEDVDRRCMAYDGPVGNTRQEMTDDEMRQIWYYAKNMNRMWTKRP